MNRQEIKHLKKQLKADNQKYSDTLEEIRKEIWPPWPFKNDPPIKVLRSKTFMVQIFEELQQTRLSVCRTEIEDFINGKAVWKQNITWDELQELKRQAGYADQLAVEVYPKDKDIVNVANMRHLWLVNFELGWKA